MPDSGTIKRMFGGIAPRYDLLNRLLSLGIDRGWRRRAVRILREGSGTAAEPALDLCCGTADLALDLAAAGFRVTGVDFSHEMLVAGGRKIAARGRAGVRLAEADALQLPFRDGTFAVATVAFGVRNLEDLDAGLAEMARVLRPAGRVAVLEFGRPRGPALRAAYRLYLGGLVPVVGRVVSGDGAAYGWLASSIRVFPDQAAFPARLERAGFRDVRVVDLSGGIAALYVGRKPAD